MFFTWLLCFLSLSFACQMIPMQLLLHECSFSLKGGPSLSNVFFGREGCFLVQEERAQHLLTDHDHFVESHLFAHEGVLASHGFG